MGFDLQADANILHLNVRRQGSGEDAPIAIDIKFETEVDIGVLVPVMGAESRESLMLSLYRFDPQHDTTLQGDFNVKFTGLSEIASWATFANHTIRLGYESKPATIGGFKFRLAGNLRANVVFSATIETPGETLVTFLAENIKNAVMVEITAPLELDLRPADSTSRQGDVERQTEIDSLEAFPEVDQLFYDAVRVVGEAGRVSVSLVQRRLKIGYNRAARLIEAMEAQGIVGPLKSDGTRALRISVSGE